MIVVALLAAVAVAAGVLRRRATARRRDRDAAIALPDLAADLARALRGGATLAVAVRSARPASPALAEGFTGVVHALDRGVGVTAALTEWSRRSGVPGADLLATACRAAPSGSHLADALDAVAVAAGDRLEVVDEARALAAQSRTSAGVLVALPPAGAVLFSVVDPQVGAVLLSPGVGALCLVVGLGLDLAGAGVAALLVRRMLR